jgi:hypothetical protein
MPSVTCIWSDFATIAKQATVRIDLSLGCKLEDQFFFSYHLNLQTSVAICSDSAKPGNRANGLQPKADLKKDHLHMDLEPSKICSQRQFLAQTNQAIVHIGHAAK